MVFDSAEFLKSFVAILAIVNPIGIVPIFLALTQGDSIAERRKTARLTALSVGLILVIAAFAGEAVLSFFGIGLPSFRVGGGILVLLMAISMLQAKQSRIRQSPSEAEYAEEKEHVAVVPLAIPLMAGPGAISVVIIHGHQAVNLQGKILLGGSIFSVALLSLISLYLAESIGKALGVTGLNIATRIMGLILASIGVQMIAQGLVKLLPGLAG
ncbi:MAG TPA: NAAT family transporter [Leucothrix sp.]|nr:NAAT family transporter [Leucothrix sp.]